LDTFGVGLPHTAVVCDWHLGVGVRPMAARRGFLNAIAHAQKEKNNAT
jgi:hypothetical protein